ncbi:S26 family signal peptidase [Gammaproteobacteria bacterium]
MRPKVTNQKLNIPGAMFFASYIGPSMNPTLLEPEIMEIVPYENRPLRVGDVVFFVPPQNVQPVVHRIVRVIPSGISTRGDNNAQEDTFLLQPQNIKGRVVAAWRGQKRRNIAGGLQGQLTGYWLHWLRILGKGVSSLLHPFYYALARYGLIAKLLSAPFRPKVVVFQTQGHDQYRLLLGKHIIGRYDDEKCQWKIKRPFRLLVNERVLLKSVGSITPG